MDFSNFMLGRYVMLAVNDPKNYPSEPISADMPDDNQDQEQMDSTDEARLNAMMNALAARATQPDESKAQTINQQRSQNGGHK